MKRIFKTTLLTALMSLLVCVCALFGLTGCDVIQGLIGGGTSAEITLDKQTVQLYVNGKDATVRAMLTPADSTAVYEWTIDDATIASIKPAQSTCKVSPLKEGTATLTITAGGATATCTINVGADQHVQLKAPSFTYDGATGIINITDPNTSGVKGYELQFYQEGNDKAVATVEVKNGEAVDLRRIEKGTYTVKLIALGLTENDIPSAPSESTATIEVTTEPLYEMGTGDAGALAKENNWAYYSFDWVIVDTEQAYFYDGVVHFSFSNNAADATTYQWITQLIYNYGKGEEGKLYKMVLNINTTAPGRVTLGNKAVTLVEGDNLVTVAFSGTDLFKIMFGVSGEKNTMIESTIKLSIVGEVEETARTPLQLPESFTYNAEDNTIDIVDTKNNKYDVNYTLGFFNKADDIAPQGTAIVVDGGEVDTTSVASGTYFLKMMSATTGDPYTSSIWSEANGTITVVNNKVPIVNGGQGASASNADKWYEWHCTYTQDQPVQAAIEEAYVDADGNVHITYSVEDNGAVSAQPVKLHYNSSAINEGDIYTFSCKVTSPVAGHITVNDKVFAIKEGENEISVTRTQPNKSNGGGMRTTITIQMGAVVGEETIMMQGTFVFSDIELVEVDPTPLAKPSFTYNSDAQSITVSDSGNEGKDVDYVVGFFANETATSPVATAAVAGDGKFDITGINGGTYSLRIKATSEDPLLGDSEWSDVAGSIVIVTERLDVESGNNAKAFSNQGTWYYYKQSQGTVNEIYFDRNNYIHLNIDVVDDSTSDEPVKIFYMDADLVEGDVYTVSFTFVSPMAGAIKVNDQTIEIKEGENKIDLEFTHKEKKSGNNTVTIRFAGKVDDVMKHVDGEILIKDLKVEKVVAEENA